jgi:predicted Zn-dependent protease
MLSKLADVKTNLEKNGLPTKDVDKKIELLKGNGEQTKREESTTDFETLLNNPNLSVELLDEFEASNPNLSRADWGKLDNKRQELIKANDKKELARRYEAARKKADIDSYTWSLMSDTAKKEVLKQSGL